MPYYVYKISTGSAGIVKNLELLNQFDVYKDAKALARELRAAGTDNRTSVKLIFAQTELEAEQRLTEVREQPVLREWEK